MTLLEFLQLLKKKWYFLVIFPVLFGVATAVYCWGFMTNNYTSSVSLYILTTGESQSVTSSEMSLSQQLANDLSALAKTNRVIDATAKEVGLEDLDGYSVQVTNDNTNRMITISVTGKRPEAVAEIADALAAETASVAIEVMDLNAVNIIDKAEISESPSGPNRPKYTAMAFLAGIASAIVLIVLLYLVDDTVKTAEEIEELVGLPNLGTMPTVKKLR